MPGITIQVLQSEALQVREVVGEASLKVGMILSSREPALNTSANHSHLEAPSLNFTASRNVAQATSLIFSPPFLSTRLVFYSLTTSHVKVSYPRLSSRPVIWLCP